MNDINIVAHRLHSITNKLGYATLGNYIINSVTTNPLVKRIFIGVVLLNINQNIDDILEKGKIYLTKDKVEKVLIDIKSISLFPERYLDIFEYSLDNEYYKQYIIEQSSILSSWLDSKIKEINLMGETIPLHMEIFFK